MGEIFNLTPGKADNENDTLAARAAEQLGEVAAILHDQQSRRKTRKGKTKTGRKTTKPKGKKGMTERKEDKRSGRRVGDSYWEDPDETPRKSLVRLFDGSGGSTPQTRSSEEEPNTDDRDFIKGDDEPLSDPSYHPSDDEEEWGSSLDGGDQETKREKPMPGGAWIDDADGKAVWVPEDIGGGGPGEDPFAGIFGHGGGPGAAHTPKGKKDKKQSKKKRKKAENGGGPAGSSLGGGRR